MKRTMKRTILMLLIAFGALSCSKEEIKRLEGKVDVTVYVKDNNGTPLKNWEVYAYDEWRGNTKVTRTLLFTRSGRRLMMRG